MPRVVEAGAFDATVELDVLLQIEFAVHILEVPAKFRPGREALAPAPVPPQLGVRVFVERHMAVDPCAGIAVPVPDPAQVRSGLEQADPEPKLPQPPELIEAAEACAYDDDLERFGRW